MTAVAEILSYHLGFNRAVRNRKRLPKMRLDILNRRIINWDEVLAEKQVLDSDGGTFFKSEGNDLVLQFESHYEDEESNSQDEIVMNLHIKASPTSPIRTLFYGGKPPKFFLTRSGDFLMRIDANGNVTLGGPPLTTLRELYDLLTENNDFVQYNSPDYEGTKTPRFLEEFAYDIRDPAYMQRALVTARGFGDAYGAAERHLKRSQEGIKGYPASELKFAQLIKPGERRAFSPLTEILSFFKPKPL